MECSSYLLLALTEPKAHFCRLLLHLPLVCQAANAKCSELNDFPPKRPLRLSDHFLNIVHTTHITYYSTNIAPKGLNLKNVVNVY